MTILQESRSFPFSLGEFKEKELEEEFLSNEFNLSLKHVKPLVLVFGFIFFLFIIPDYLLTGSQQTLAAMLVLRSTFFLFAVLLYFRLPHLGSYTRMVNYFTLYKVMASAFFLMIYFIYESPTFMMKSLGTISIIIIIFFMPNRWINAVLVSLALSLGFFAVSAVKMQNVSPMEFLGVVVFVLLVVVLSAITSYKINYYRRLDFLNMKNMFLLSVTDMLTGIYNRGKFDDELHSWVAVSKRYKSPLSLVIFDLDDLKKVNDTFGHLTGDRVIYGVARIVSTAIRETDIFARWGGDEFVILLPNTQEEQAVQLTNRISFLINERHFNEAGRISCSFGVVELQEDDNTGTLLNRADKMLYAAKDRGKNLVVSENFPGEHRSTGSKVFTAPLQAD